MTIEEIKKRVKDIDEIKNDNENAHIFEDELHLDFIRYISLRNDDIGKMAKEIIKTSEINFARWHA